MTAARRTRSNTPDALSIGAVSRATGIPVQTLRTWETRYGAPEATRKPSGHRVYAATVVPRLRRIARLLALGHRPADLFARAEADLDALLAAAGATLPEGAVAAPRARTRAARASRGAAADAKAFDRLMLATREMDRVALRAELRAAAASLDLLEFLGGFAGAFLSRLGEDWSKGTLDIRHEHFASACVFDVLREMRDPLDARARGPRVVVASLPGEQHEGGLLIASVLIAHHGWRVTWLGPDTPVAEIAAAALARGTSAVLVSVSAAGEPARTKRALTRLRESLPRRMPLWLGGAGAPERLEGAERFTDLAELAARLARGD